jgi:hypothetical protein
MKVMVQRQAAPGHRLQVRIEAEAPHPIRAVKILVRGLPRLTLLDLLDQEPNTPTEQIIRRYPNDARIPLVFARTADGVTIGARCEDPQARAKRFVFYQERMGPPAPIRSNASTKKTPAILIRISACRSGSLTGTWICLRFAASIWPLPSAHWDSCRGSSAPICLAGRVTSRWC